jgi:hypothetical protein
MTAGGRGPSPAGGFPTPVETFVSPAGNDGNPGTQATPLRSLQKALDVAQPGGVIRLAPGLYEPSQTRRSGLPDALSPARARRHGLTRRCKMTAHRFRTEEVP